MWTLQLLNVVCALSNLRIGTLKVLNIPYFRSNWWNIIGEMKYIPYGPCTFRQRKTTKESNAQKDTVSSHKILSALTWFLGRDIDNAALWTHSSAVIGPQGHVISTAALQIPDEDWSFIPHCPDHTGCVRLLPLPPVLQLKTHNKNTNYTSPADLLLNTFICNCTIVGMNPRGFHDAHIL